MKTMKCNQLGGACELEFKAETFEEIAALSQAHGKEMYQLKDAAHLEAMSKIQDMMQTPGDMESWQEQKRKEFEALPES
jgi:predicted small metal-binding protein